MGMQRNALTWMIGLVLVAGIGTGCAHRAVPTPPGPQALGDEPYVIGPSDVLSVSVWKNPELSVANVPVRPDGKISVPLVPKVQAAGLTTDELKQALTEKLSEYVTAPEVTVVVTEVNSKRVYVVGEVARPTTIPLTQDLRVLDAIAIAGGFNPFADKNDIRILRHSNGDRVEYRFNMDQYLDGDAPEANLVLRPGDTIVVPD